MDILNVLHCFLQFFYIYLDLSCYLFFLKLISFFSFSLPLFSKRLLIEMLCFRIKQRIEEREWRRWEERERRELPSFQTGVKENFFSNSKFQFILVSSSFVVAANSTWPVVVPMRESISNSQTTKNKTCLEVKWKERKISDRKKKHFVFCVFFSQLHVLYVLFFFNVHLILTCQNPWND